MSATNYKPADFEYKAAVANATAVSCCVLACQRTQRSTGRRTASHEALANGALAPLTGEQAAVGQTARLNRCIAPSGVPVEPESPGPTVR